MSKPSTVLKLKASLLSMLSHKERPTLERLRVALVRDNHILRILVKIFSVVNFDSLCYIVLIAVKHQILAMIRVLGMI